MMKEIFWAESQNGRWGVSIVSESYSPVDTAFPVQAEITALGAVAGKNIYRIEKTQKPQWLLVTDDAEPISGASMIETMDMQGHRCVTLLLLGEEAIVREYGYRRRSSIVSYYKRGEVQTIPESVLLALGLIPASHEPEPIGPPPAFRIDGNHKSAIVQAIVDTHYLDSNT